MKHAHKISWILFGALAVIYIALSLISVVHSYVNPSGDLIAGRFTPAEVANGDEAVAAALSARRGTAAAFGLGYGILLLGAVLAYRKERRAFGWIVAASLVNVGVILLRIPLLGVTYGLAGGTIPLVVILIATALGLLDRRTATA